MTSFSLPESQPSYEGTIGNTQNISSPHINRQSIYEQIRFGLISGTLHDPIHRVAPSSTANEAVRAHLKSQIDPSLRKREEEYLCAWVLAQQNLGIPLDFTSKHTHTVGTMTVEGRNFPAVWGEGVDHAYRAQIIATQNHHQPQLGAEGYPNLDLDSCNLCRNAVLALDAVTSPDLGTNALGIWEKEKILFMANKFSYSFGDGLIIELNHSSDSGEALLNLQTVLAVMAISDRYHLVVQRNHGMDGKVAGAIHDCFKVSPEKLTSNAALFGADGIIDLNRGKTNGVEIYSPENTPWDTMVLASENRNYLAKQLVQLINRMAKNGEVYTLIYAQGQWLITPRDKKQIGDIPLGTNGTGSTIGSHAFAKDTDHLQRALKYTPLKGYYHWKNYL